MSRSLRGARSASKSGGRSPCWRCGLVVALVGLCASSLAADDFRATVKQADVDRATLTVMVGREERTFTLSPKAKFLGLNRTPLKDGLYSRLLNRPAVLMALKTEQSDGREVVVEIEVLRRSASPVRGKP